MQQRPGASGSRTFKCKETIRLSFHFTVSGISAIIFSQVDLLFDQSFASLISPDTPATVISLDWFPPGHGAHSLEHLSPILHLASLCVSGCTRVSSLYGTLTRKLDKSRSTWGW